MRLEIEQSLQGESYASRVCGQRVTKMGDHNGPGSSRLPKAKSTVSLYCGPGATPSHCP
ncbi:hypothetical protein FA10DRAFT_269471 [Acaromyces ingoldii]|uniref:Uncharacterized protein n=1 Tax=Acaromyces ingoldii TaxID=215250 RepID=A0A316YDM7_9BASI|nr:hypothetical protein FA10DRAFT_269471 [Acaromyces ingoldii]PWN87517.1 hypothetical protein FA10DRAFT_269471 [Acaromyces ingoldii]